jgi:hypothetical protein
MGAALGRIRKTTYSREKQYLFDAALIRSKGFENEIDTKRNT